MSSQPQSTPEPRLGDTDGRDEFPDDDNVAGVGVEADATTAEDSGAVAAAPQRQTADDISAPAAGERALDLTDELGSLRDRHLRLAAEYDNFRKRTERERAESWMRAQADLAGRLLDPFDDLQRVAHQDAGATSVDALLEGVQLVERKLLRALDAAGLEVIDPAGEPFDPQLHEALMTTPADTAEEDETVDEVFQKGYRLKDLLLRPARVRVKKYR